MDEGNLADSQMTGEQKEDTEPKVAIKKKDIYPGVSSQKRVKLRAEQLFKEGQADKAIKNQEVLQHRLRKKAEKEQSSLEEGDKKRPTI
eukprot:4543556-Heterocapsa_arctica.AAC.1